jgi:hypothetical protein
MAKYKGHEALKQADIDRMISWGKAPVTCFRCGKLVRWGDKSEAFSFDICGECKMEVADEYEGQKITRQKVITTIFDGKGGKTETISEGSDDLEPLRISLGGVILPEKRR